MKIEIVSFVNNLNNKERVILTSQIINNSNSDILLFSGHTIEFVKDLEELRTVVDNKRTEVIFELESINSNKINNCLYRISKGNLFSLNSNQLFSTSNEIEGNYELALRLIYELESHRKFKKNNFVFLIIQCGELNILKNIQADNNKVDFRLSEFKVLKDKFNSIIKETNVFLNPIHIPMGNQGKMKKRREYLSKNKKYYFSTSNTKENSNDLMLDSLQYGYYNGFQLKPISSKIINKAKSTLYEIK